MVQDTEWLKNIFRSEWCLEAVRARTPQFVVFLSVSSLVVCELQFQQLPCDSGSSSVSVFSTQCSFLYRFVVFTRTQRCQANGGAEFVGKTVGLPAGMRAVPGNGGVRAVAWGAHMILNFEADVVPIGATMLSRSGRGRVCTRKRPRMLPSGGRVTRGTWASRRMDEGSKTAHQQWRERQETVDVSRKGTRQKLRAQEEKRRAQFWRRFSRKGGKLQTCETTKPGRNWRSWGLVSACRLVAQG